MSNMSCFVANFYFRKLDMLFYEGYFDFNKIVTCYVSEMLKPDLWENR